MSVFRRVGCLVSAALLLAACGGSDPASAPADEFDSDVTDARSSVESYWTSFFESQGGQFVPVEDLFAYDEPSDGECGGEPFVLNNAFFCPSGNFIAYDVNFVEGQYDTIGDAFVYYLIGHEYAHAVQDSLGITHQLTIQHELQADCMAGAYLGDSVRGEALLLEDGDLDELLGSLASVGDQPDVPWFAEGAHGSGAQRTEAFQQGSRGTSSGASSLGTCL
ncbi:neutral zinc metallopeptidase [Kineosporia sp. J2-2]|uniref:Neutral zinc metallopeptidase n=1 Tax=Kineosporia corallincola TaxID=2835133 RepID=A0ABS5TEH5_9ACTN|nr:neutral zinc metallopeptidase [Kineosporia corallincola]MBT0769446.1 neutral zinc metallopeptidase [Kineosporia corallincola]